MDTRQRIENRLREAFAPVDLSVEDESHHHRGHAGAAGGGGHFRARIVSERFAGLSLVARHRLVYAELADEMAAAVHALALETLTPAEASKPT
jgi:BolA protein